MGMNRERDRSEPVFRWKRQGVYLAVHVAVLGIGLALPLPRGEALFGMGLVPNPWKVLVLVVLPAASIALLGGMLMRGCRRNRAGNLAFFVGAALVVWVVAVLLGT